MSKRNPHSIDRKTAFGDGGRLSRLTRRTASASARRPKTVIALWLLFVVGLAVAGTMTGTRMLTGNEENVGESAAANTLLEKAGLGDPAVENLMVSTGDPAATRATTASLVKDLRSDPDVKKVGDPYAAQGSLADGGRKALVQATLRGDPDQAVDRIDGLDSAVSAIEANFPDATVNVVGPGTIDKEINQVIGEDLHTAEMISLPITLLILLIAFGALVAASVPLMLGVTSVIAAIGGFGLISQVFPAGDAGMSLVVLLGLAVGVDYSLFYIRREREEKRAGRGADAALIATSATIGRAIVISGVTVIIGLGGLLVTGLPMFVSMGLATMLVVLIAMIGSLTVLPATLALLGDRIDKGRLPWLKKRGIRPASLRCAARISKYPALGRVPDVKMGFWDRLARMVTRRPLLAMVTAACLLGAIAVPAIGMKTGEAEYGLPKDTKLMVDSAAIEASFPGAPDTADLVASGSGLDSPESRQGLATLGQRALEITGGQGSVEVKVAADGETALVRVPAPRAGSGNSAGIVHELRDQIPALARQVTPEASLKVTGGGAEGTDFDDRLAAVTPIVIGMVLILALVLLFVTFRSLPLALSVIGLNLLSMAATYGVITAVFQNTWAEGLLDFTSSGNIASWVPLNAFVILFGLSMDYTILVLERIRESRRAGRSPRMAAREGVAATAGTITSAAAVMVAVFAIFPTLPLIEMKMLGIALAVGILIDATIVRGIALPAMVALLGERGVKAPARATRRRPVPATRPDTASGVPAWSEDAR